MESSKTQSNSINPKLNEISLSEINNLDLVQIGNAENQDSKKGVTVIYFPYLALGGVDVSGGGPASRELNILDPRQNDTPINAIVLSGGSAFGLEASCGVMEYLRDQDLGLPTLWGRVPIVLQSCIFDLCYGSLDIKNNFVDKKMGAEAIKNALEYKNNELKIGNHGAGIGATVGKFCGMKRASKSGLGIAGYSTKDGLIVVAIVTVNAIGDVFKDGEKIAGLMDNERKNFVNSQEIMLNSNCKNLFGGGDSSTTNTTIGVVVTNADLSKSDCLKVANMTRGAYCKCIRPVNLMLDGDTIYTVSTGKNKMKADLNYVGILSEYVMEKAICKAIEESKVSDEEFLKNIIEGI